MEIEQGDILLCNVDKIEGTTVFVNIDGTETRGTIILSEISAGRIRNLRDYVVPKKTIICKVLRVMNDHIELSLRRVTQKEQKERMGKAKLEKSYSSILKTILKEQTKEIIKKIKENHDLGDFLEDSKKNPKELEKLTGKENSKKILDILKSQKKKTQILKKQITFHSNNPQGILLIKKILGDITTAKIKYIAAGKYSIQKEAETIKKADQEIEKILEKIEKFAKSEKIEFSLK